MKAASSRNTTSIFISRLTMASIAGALAITGLVAAPELCAETPPDQIKAAGAIRLTTELLDKMDKFLKNLGTDEAAKAEFVAVAKESSFSPETWSSAISAKCPKAIAFFKASGLTPNEFTRGFFAITAVDAIDELAKSENKTVKANADFIAANKDRADTIFGAFLMLAQPGPAPASTTP